MLEVISGISLFLSLASYKGEMPRQDIQCIARAIYHEARGEPITGRIAVGHVIMNRVGHPWYENTICGVVYQARGFTGLFRDTPMLDGKRYKASIQDAIMVYTGYVDDPTKGAITYHNPKTAPNPKWDFSKLVYAGDIYNHRFYKLKAKE